MLNELGSLADPANNHAPIDVNGTDRDLLLAHYKSMVRIRLVENHLALMRQRGFIGGPVHLGVGQEAIAVGVSSSLRRTDRVFGAHRSHAHSLALGSSIYGLFAEVLGRDTGLSRGMGGSMHLWDQPRGFYGSVPIVAGTVPLAVGAGLAAALQACDDVAVAYFGDGAVEEGVVHESLNLAAVMKLPVLFVVENNLFSSHMHISLRQTSDSVARFGRAHNMPTSVVDGNDVVHVSKVAAEMIEHARAGQGPSFLEAVTFRWYGHVDWREDIDVGVNRSSSDLASWRKRDPIKRLADSLRAMGWLDDQIDAQIQSDINDEIKSSWDRAMSDPYPSTSCLLERVYADRPTK